MMSIQFNHTIIPAKDSEYSANFLAEILGLASPTRFASFVVVKTDNNVSLDFRTTPPPIKSRHYAFLVSENEFEQIFKRVTDKKLTYWADPAQKQQAQINHNDGGRGFYFLDPDGHFLEVITRPYGYEDSINP